ncbi:MAG TPA: endopygalactorunase [Bacteroidales bacterium]|nr:endopygalactorunase [Bacteroidales bacterium]
MKKTIGFVFFVFFLPGLIFASTQSSRRFDSGIAFCDSVQKMGSIVGDTLIFFKSSTYSFTVDTPEDQGLVSSDLSIEKIPEFIHSKDGVVQTYQITNALGVVKTQGKLESGDRLNVISTGKKIGSYFVKCMPAAYSGELLLFPPAMTQETSRDLVLHFTAGQRSPNSTVKIYIPQGIEITKENTLVNVIGRGTVFLKDLDKQSIGRVGTNYSYSKVGQVSIEKYEGGTVLVFRNLDLRPSNGADLVLTIKNVRFPKAGKFPFRAVYTTNKPEVLTSAGLGSEMNVLTVNETISDFERVLDANLKYQENPQKYTQVDFKWSPIKKGAEIQLMKSVDEGKNWELTSVLVDETNAKVSIKNLEPNKDYLFRLRSKKGSSKGFSNIVRFYSGKMDVKRFGVIADGKHDNTDQINKAIEYLHQSGGGTLLFSEGTYSVRTIHLKSNVYLYLEKEATIKALKGSDAPELSWFCSKQYRSGLSPTDKGPYADPENFLTKQDVGHSYFRNALFFGERLDNVKIIGNGRITGDGTVGTSDKIMNNPIGSRADKLFSLKLCTNVEIGGIDKEKDLWYGPEKDEPYYREQNGEKDEDCGNMLNIDRGGHFVLLATGTDHIYMHDTYLGKFQTSNVRDIYDFMGCNDAIVSNIYCKVSSDDIVKLGSDCSLGFTRPSQGFKVRNIIGDTNCNLFQIGSESADDITDVCVDNIYVLGGNKAGFSISTNDGGHVKNIHLNCGHTGTVHSISEMYRTTAPFFISISNRGRVLGANVSRYKFTENGNTRDELLCTNVSLGKVENISLKGVNVYEVYGGSSFKGKRWEQYDGTQRRATPIVAGYKLPDSADVAGGLNFTLPDSKHTGYIENITFEHIHFLVKGGNPASDSELIPRELGVGQYNVSNLGIQPAYGLWARHVKDLVIDSCSFNYEKPDQRYAVYLDDVQGASLHSVGMVKAADSPFIIGLKKSSSINLINCFTYQNSWGNSVSVVPNMEQLSGNQNISIAK